tara:strand:+ start:1518 stop:2714 length:1197 start_codon:yes stop_codon:yes gene_type:complete
MTNSAAVKTSKPKFWFEGLDGLRAFGALLIVVHHAGFSSGLTFRSDFFGQFFSRMDIGVSIFFVLSGFLLFRPFVLNQFEETSSDKIGHFWIRRICRIYPAYWLALLVLLGFGAIQLIGAGQVTMALSLTQIYDPTWGLFGISQAWSLATELSFYLLLPLFALLARRLTRNKSVDSQARFLILLCFGLSLFSYAFRFLLTKIAPDSGSWWASGADLWMPSYLDTFSIGMVLAVISAWETKQPKVRRATEFFVRQPFLWWIIGAALFWLVSTQLNLPRGFGSEPWFLNLKTHMARQTLYWIIGACLLIPLVFKSNTSNKILDFFSSRPMAYLGSISYGIYLWHQGFLTWAHSWLDWPELTGNFFSLLLISICGSVLVAGLSFRFLEEPLNKKLRHQLQH